MIESDDDDHADNDTKAAQVGIRFKSFIKFNRNVRIVLHILRVATRMYSLFS